MKKVYLVCIYTITAFCIILGTIINVLGNFRIGDWTWEISNELLERKECEIEGVSDDVSITIDSQIGDIKVKRGDKFHVSYGTGSKLTTSVESDESTIKITQTKIKNNLRFGDIKGTADIILTVPADAKIENLDIDNALGDIDVQDITFEDCTVDENLGDVKFDNCTFTNLDVSNDLGDIVIASCGDFKDYDIDADVSLGSISFFGANHDDSYECDGTKGSLTLDDSLGDIIIK